MPNPNRAVEAVARALWEKHRADTLARIRAGKVSASMSGIEWYDGGWEEAAPTTKEYLRGEAQTAIRALTENGASPMGDEAMNPQPEPADRAVVKPGRDLCWFSDGIASAIATKFWLREHPDALIVHCDTGSEDEDNARFRAECEAWLGKPITILKNPDFADNYAVWTKRRYMSGIAGAPCTMEQKVTPRLAFQQPGDVHVFGYTFDSRDRERFAHFQKNYPDLIARAPLIEREISKANCLAMMQDTGIAPPRTYAMGFPNANCLMTGCVKATSPAYWALFRKVFPERFAKTAALAREIGCRLARINGERVFIDDIPADWPTLNPVAPACDFLCHINGQDLAE